MTNNVYGLMENFAKFSILCVFSSDIALGENMRKKHRYKMTTKNSTSSVHVAQCIEQIINNKCSTLTPIGVVYVAQVAKARFNTFPTALLNEEICAIALNVNGRNLEWIPSDIMTSTMAMIAVLNRGSALEHVRPNLITAELCQLAVAQDPTALKFVPHEFCTKELCFDAIRRDSTNSHRYVPKEFRTQEFYKYLRRFLPLHDMAFVKKSGTNLAKIRKHRRTAELCDAAVAECGMALGAVPEALRTSDLVWKAIRNRGDAIQYVIGTPLCTPELLMAAVTSESSGLSEIPEDISTLDLYTAAVRTCGSNLSVVPENLRTRKMYKQAGRTEYMDLSVVPYRYRTRKMCTDLLKNGAIVLKDVPVEFRTADLCRIAVNQPNGHSLEHVPLDIRDQDMCLLAVRNDGRELKDVPMEFRTSSMCMAAVQQNATAIRHIPSKVLTLDHCIAAMQSSATGVFFLSEEALLMVLNNMFVVA